jgi:hypothetical protein
LKRKNSEKMMKKLQAAMEYLMTYGWAILIIVLALGVLYSLGVFNPAKLKPVACVFSAPFSCDIQSFTSSGQLTFTFAQGSGKTYVINKIACVDNSLIDTNTGLPVSSFTGWNSSVNKQLPSGSTITLTVPCYVSTNTIYSGPVGSSFGGTLVVNYTVQPSNTPGSISGSVNVQVTRR